MQEGLPLRPSRTLSVATKTGHWMSSDMRSDGRTIVFNLVGDICTMPITGGNATPLTRGMAFHAQPRLPPDGKKIVFVRDRSGGYNLCTISVDKRDTVQLTTGNTNSYGSPVWTPDSKYVIATRGQKLWLFREGGGTGIQRIRPAGGGELLTGAVQRDDQKSRATLDVYTGMNFTPDSKAPVTTWDGKFWRVDVATKQATEIPFEVDVVQALGPKVAFDYPISDSAGHAEARDEGGEFEPTWSPDGRYIALTTWADTVGYRSRGDGTGAVQRLTPEDGMRTNPVYTLDGLRIVATRGPASERYLSTVADVM
ncbi:MAG TPA: hypothetical protein VE869_17640 [Gemmatimonas sp.]|nr:hypothetical protein [Gemmatimonas sp.]